MCCRPKGLSMPTSLCSLSQGRDYNDKRRRYLHLTKDYSTALNTKEAFVPPNPKLFDMATLTFFCCASKGTKLNRAPTSGLCKFKVGGTAPCNRGSAAFQTVWMPKKTHFGDSKDCE